MRKRRQRHQAIYRETSRVERGLPAPSLGQGNEAALWSAADSFEGNAMNPPARLRALLAEPDFVVMPAVWDGLTAKLAAGGRLQDRFPLRIMRGGEPIWVGRTWT